MARIAGVLDAVSNAAYVGVAGGAIVFTTLGILYDVAVRAAGFQPPVWTSAATEYAMLVLTMAITPYLVRHRANVQVDLVANLLPPRPRRWLLFAVTAVAAALCLLIVVVAVRLGLAAHARGDHDMRAIELPRWVLFALLAAGFGASAIEFLRQLTNHRSVEGR